MNASSLLFRYISRSFLKCFVAMTLGLYVIISLFDFAELQRQTTFKEVTMATKLSMVFLRVPSFLEQALPFLIFLAALFVFWQMNRSCELIIFRSMGLSLWRTILPVSLTALIIGGVDLTIFNSLSSTMLSRYNQLEKKYLSGMEGDIAVESTGVWLKDPLRGQQIIYRANQVNLKTLEFSGLNIIILSPENFFRERIDAKSGQILGNKLHLKNGWTIVAGEIPRSFVTKEIDTSLTQAKIEKMKLKSIISSFWDLPAYISLLEGAGLKGLKYRMYWHFLLASSFWPAAMVLLAAGFASRPLRQGKTLMLILLGLGCGFLLYFFKDIMFSFGVSGKLPPVVAAWLPTLLSFMIGSIAVFIQEDG